MNSTIVDIFSSNKDLVDSLSSDLESSSLELFISINPADRSGGIVIYDADSIERPDLLQESSSSVIVISKLQDQENLQDLIDRYQINHLVGHTEDQVSEEIIIVLRKMLSKNIWGIESYLSSDAQVCSIEIDDSNMVAGATDQLLENFDLSSFFDSPAEYIRLIGNELLTNAVYNAAIGEKTDRKTRVHLVDGDIVRCKIGMGSRYIGISVEDNHGKFVKDVLVANLLRCFKDKTHANKEGGAGLGLYMVYSHSNQFIVNFSKGKKTEVICLIDKNKRYKKYKSRITSFHYFNEDLG